jgi:hypothetical protein
MPSHNDVGTRLSSLVRDVCCIVTVYDTDAYAVGFERFPSRDCLTYLCGVGVSMHSM